MISVLRKLNKSYSGAYPNDYIDDEDGIYAEFICDDDDDIPNLPTDYSTTFGFKPRPGSSALDCENAELYVLSPTSGWKSLKPPED